MAIDLDYINQFGIDVAGNVQNITTLVSSINSFMTMPDEARCIDNIYLDFEAIGKKAVETRTYNWARLGELLFHLQDRYNKNPSINRVKDSWTKFAANNFTNFGKRRRENAVKLFLYGKKLEKYYFLGIDEVLYVFGNFLSAKKQNNEVFKQIKNKFEFSFNDPVDTEEERQVFRSKVDKICEYSKNIDEVVKVGANTELYYRCISVGCIASKKVISKIGSFSLQEEKDRYLAMAIANRGFDEQRDVVRTSNAQATVGLICKFMDNIEAYKSEELNIPSYLDLHIVNETIEGLCWIKDKIRGVDNGN